MTEHLTTYGDFFFFNFFFFSTTYRQKHEENEGEPSWQHEDLIKNHKNEAADHRKNQEATKNSPTHTYGDFFVFFQFFFFRYDLPTQTWRKRRWAKLTPRRFDKEP